LTDSQRSELVRRYAAGESANALAREFGIHRRTAARIIRAAGADVRYRVEIDAETARELYESGYSLVRVGERLGASPGTVLKVLRRAGVLTREVGTNQWG
jgi:DNA invertase Pin-like site-specific DNA recombinase